MDLFLIEITGNIIVLNSHGHRHHLICIYIIRKISHRMSCFQIYNYVLKHKSVKNTLNICNSGKTRCMQNSHAGQLVDVKSGKHSIKIPNQTTRQITNLQLCDVNKFK